MKRQTEFICFLFILFATISFRIDFVRQINKSQNGLVVSETKSASEECVEPVGKTQDIFKRGENQSVADESIPKIKQIAVISDSPKPVEPALSVVLESASEPGVEDTATKNSDPLTFESKEREVSIVMISVCDPETEVIAPSTVEKTHICVDLSKVKGFQILGNPEEMPFNLVVNSRYLEGCEKIYFLDWDAEHPNEFRLNGSLGYATYILVFNHEMQVAHFNLCEPCNDEYIALDLNATVELAYAP